MKIAVLGAGAWCTAIARAAAVSAAHEVLLYARDPAQAKALGSARSNARYLPGVALPESLALTSSLDAALTHAGAGLIVCAAPTAALRDLARLARSSHAAFVWLCKGFERESGLLPHQVVAEEFGAAQAERRSGPLSGPSFAQEVAAGLPTALTVAGEADFCARVTLAFHAGALRIYSSDDVVGVEVGGAVKNVMAIATGIADALELGANARAALITRGLAEITRLGVALGARAETFMGLTGVGDLILTCTGELSRNRSVGLMLGRGMSLADALAELGHVAEGVRSAPAIAARARAAGVDMPITMATCAVLEGRLSPRAALETLLARDPKREGGKA
jgi:glycerol-3-phosphate dehydrogenase (NAD(P)+)